MSRIVTNYYPEICPDLNIADIDTVVDAAGPGRRLVIWLQGCLKRCLGCANGLFWANIIKRIMNINELIDLLNSNIGLDGITLSGGEPVIQAAALIPFLGEVHRRNLSTVCYSGYSLNELSNPDNDQCLGEFLKRIDLLIDGEYIRDKPRQGLYRPSSNQGLHFLSDRISIDSTKNIPETVFSIKSKSATSTGTLPQSILREISDRLRAEGVTLKSVI